MSDDELIKRITAQLDAGSERLDGTTRSRLTQARHRALAEHHHHRRSVWIMPTVGGAVLASLVAVTVWLGRAPEKIDLHAASDFEMLTEGDSIELYQELEFLQWLEGESNGVV